MNRAELIANMEATAAKLCGRAVIVRIKHNPGAVGLAQKDLAGRAVIDLDPVVFENVKDFAETFTHEIAHIVKHFGSMPRRDTEKDASQEIQRHALILASLRGNPIVKRHEDEADELASQWMAVIKQYHDGYTAATGSPYMAVLQILYHKVKP